MPLVEKYIHKEADKQLIFKYFDSPYERTSIAMVENIPMDYLMYDVFNNIGEETFEKSFSYRGRIFHLTYFSGLCDDYYGNRYCKFGTPFVIRVYINGETPIPNEVFDMADWNFMSARKEKFLGYVYGSFCNDSVYIAGIQSDLCQRYTYLFSQYTETFYKTNNAVVYIENDLIVNKYKYVIPYIRKSFQREWIDILMKAVLECRSHNKYSNLYLLKYEFQDEDGEVVDRIYHQHFEKYLENFIQIGNQSYSALSLNALVSLYDRF